MLDEHEVHSTALRCPQLQPPAARLVDAGLDGIVRGITRTGDHAKSQVSLSTSGRTIASTHRHLRTPLNEPGA